MPPGQGHSNLGRALYRQFLIERTMKKRGFFFFHSCISHSVDPAVCALPIRDESRGSGSFCWPLGRPRSGMCTEGCRMERDGSTSRGAFFGRRLEILVIEDTSQVAETVAAYRKLNEIDRILLLYTYSAETAIHLQSHIHFNRISTFVSFLPSSLTYPSKSPYFFSVSPTPWICRRSG